MQAQLGKYVTFSNISHQINGFPFYFHRIEIFCSYKKKSLISSLL